MTKTIVKVKKVSQLCGKENEVYNFFKVQN